MRKKASYTLEASLLMVILIPILFAVIYLTFYLHDRYYLEGAALETAVYASLHQGEERLEEQLSREEKRLTAGRMLGTRNLRGKVKLTEREVSVSYSGSFQTPGLIDKWMGKNLGHMEVTKTMKLTKPVKTLRKIKGWQKLLKK